jgi:hypothetical protein
VIEIQPPINMIYLQSLAIPKQEEQKHDHTDNTTAAERMYTNDDRDRAAIQVARAILALCPSLVQGYLWHDAGGGGCEQRFRDDGNEIKKYERVGWYMAGKRGVQLDRVVVELDTECVVPDVRRGRYPVSRPPGGYEVSGCRAVPSGRWKWWMAGS